MPGVSPGLTIPVDIPAFRFQPRRCHFCDKAFMNDSFLQDHVQRRHAEATEAERQKTKQVEQMEDEVQELKAKLQEMRQQLEAEKLRQEQGTERARQQEEEGRRDLERWKEEERTKLHEEIDGLRQLFLAAFKEVASRNSAMEGKLQELQAREVAVSNLGTLRDDDTEEAWWESPKQAELQGNWEQMAVQLKKKNKTLRAAPFQDQQAVVGSVDRQKDALSTRLREQPKVMKSQEKKIKLLSASKPEVIREVTKVVAAGKSPDREEATLGGKQRLLVALQINPNLLKQFRPILEEELRKKLESMGVKRVAKGISTRTYKSLQALVRLQQQQKAEKFPGLLHLRDELVQAVMGKVRRCKQPSTTLPQQRSVIQAQSPKRPRSLRGSQPMVIPAVVEPKASVIPQLAPWSKACSTHSPPGTPWGTLWTSKASRSHRAPVPQRRPEAKLGEKKPSPSPMKLSPRQELGVSAVVPGDETDSDVSDLDSLEELAGSGTAMSTIVRRLERCLDAEARRLPSGVKLSSALSSASPKTSQPTKKLQFAGDSSDLETSSLEDPAESPALAAADARGTTLVPRLRRSRAARGHMVVTGK
nr:PREDICTED: zinc finger protein DZIP1L [Opisthocomus hoazin]